MSNPQDPQSASDARRPRPTAPSTRKGDLKQKSILPLPIALKAANMITFVGFIVFLIPYAGSLKATYGLFLLSSLVFCLMIQRAVSIKNRGKKKIGALLLSILINVSPVIFVMSQLIVILSILKNTNIMDMRDPSGNLPDMLSHYKNASFSLIFVQMILLSIWTNTLIRGKNVKAHAYLSPIEDNILPIFIILGVLSTLFIGLLYVVLTRFITDG